MHGSQGHRERLRLTVPSVNIVISKWAILSLFWAAFTPFSFPESFLLFLHTGSSLQPKPKGFEDENAVCQVFERESGRISSAKTRGWVICPSYTSSSERRSQALLYKCVEVLSFPRDMIENIWSDACVGEKKKGLSRKSRCSLWPVIIFFFVWECLAGREMGDYRMSLPL